LDRSCLSKQVYYAIYVAKYIMGLRGKIFLEFSIPLIIGLLIIILSAYIPFLVSYNSLINELENDIYKEQKDIFNSIGSFTSESTEVMIQSTINQVMLADFTLRRYENDKLPIRSDFLFESVPINGKLLETYKIWPRKWNPKLSVSREPEWYLDPNNTIITYLSDETKENLKRAAIVDTLLGALISNVLIPGYYVGFEDGLSYMGPTRYRYIFNNDTLGAVKNCDQKYFKSTCLPFYKRITDKLEVNETVKVNITYPFYYSKTKYITQEVCIGTYKNNIRTGVICCAHEFEKAYNFYNKYSEDMKRFERFVVDKSGYVIYHPKLKAFLDNDVTYDKYNESKIPVRQIEFDNDIDSDNAERYDQVVLPTFGADVNNQTLYKDNENSNMILDVYPIRLRLSLDTKKEHMYSLGIRASYSYIEYTFRNTKSEIGTLIIIEGIIAYFLIISLSILICFASLRLYSLIVKPLNDLSCLICQMHTDLNISLTNYENCNSYEISLLFTVFERLKIIMRLRMSKYFNNSKDSVSNYTQSYRIFKQVNNIEGMFYSTYHLGFLAYLRKDYRCAILYFTTSLQLSDMLTIEPYLLLRIRKGLILCYYQLDDMNSFMILVQSSLERIEANLNSDNWAEWADTILLQCDYMVSKGFPVQNLLDVIKPKGFDPNPIIIQKMYYVQAVCYKREGRYRDSMNMLYKALVIVM